MSRFRRRRLLGLFLTIATFALVVGNLAPILWMVWCSLKDNGEIMSGKVGIGHRRVDVGFLARSGTEWLAGSADGGIGRFRESDKGLQQVRTVNFGTFATAWALDGDALWSFSADKGLRRHGADLAVVRSWGPEALQQAWLGSHPGRRWRTIWVNDVQASSVVATRTHVLAAYRMDGGPGAVVLDKATGALSFPEDLEAVDQLLAEPDSTGVWSMSPKGLMLWRGRGSASKFLAWGDSGLPWERPFRLQPLGQGEIALADGDRIRVWSQDAHRVVREIGAQDGLDRGRIQALAADWRSGGVGRLGVACARGVVILDRQAGRSIDSASDESPLRSLGLSLDCPAFEPLVLGISGNQLAVGGERGCLAAGPMLADAGGWSSKSASLPEGAINVHWRNYVDLWRNLPFGTYLMNSLLICGSVMLISMVLASMAGYALARFEFGGKEIFGYSILATQMIPGILFLIPLYILFVRAGDATGIAIVGTRWGLVLLYSAFYVPFTIWILRGFFAAIPKELEEAALVDGCTPFRAFWSVVLPAALPGIVASGIYVFLTVWDELMFAWILTNAETSTIPVGIRLFAGNYQNRYDLMMAAATVATLPVMLLFFLMQRRIVSGLTAGAVKG